MLCGYLFAIRRLDEAGVELMREPFRRLRTAPITV
jgi:hypothetical protein